jgi:hypothetical protein
MNGVHAVCIVSQYSELNNVQLDCKWRETEDEESKETTYEDNTIAKSTMKLIRLY